MSLTVSGSVNSAGTEFNFQMWNTVATQNTSNPNMKVFLTIPANQSEPLHTVEALTCALKRKFASFGGVMLSYSLFRRMEGVLVHCYS